MATHKQLLAAVIKIQEAYYGVTCDVRNDQLEIRDPSGTMQVTGFLDTDWHRISYAEAANIFPAANLPQEE